MLINKKQKMKIKNNKKGFTLIELMVVIAIVALMSSIVLSALTSTRTKARDTDRIAELRNIEKALHLYSISNNGTVPIASPSFTVWSDFYSYNSSTLCATAGNPNLAVQGLFTALINAKTLPTRPLNDPMSSKGYCYIYMSDSAGKWGILATALEGQKNTDGNQSVVGVVFGTNPPSGLNINLTTGLKDIANTPLIPIP